MPSELRKLAKWTAIILFFMIVPAAILFACKQIITLLDGSAAKAGVSQDFAAQAPSILLAFYFGGIGAIVAYIYSRIQGAIGSEALIQQMAKLLFGGLMGVAGALFLKSNALIKLLYPKLPTDGLQDVSSSSLMMLSFMCGLLGPYLVKAAQDRVTHIGSTETKTLTRQRSAQKPPDTSSPGGA